MGFFTKIENKFKSAAKNVGRTAGKMANSVSHAAAGVVNTGKKVVSTVYNDTKSLITNLPTSLAHAASTMLGAGGDALGKLGSSLIIPISSRCGGCYSVAAVIEHK
jgi:hypothetical protein